MAVLPQLITQAHTHKHTNFATLSGDCGVPRKPANAEMYISGTTAGHKILYNCSTMYKLIGSSSRICQNSGEWSGTLPSCSRELYVDGNL